MGFHIMDSLSQLLASACFIIAAAKLVWLATCRDPAVRVRVAVSDPLRSAAFDAKTEPGNDQHDVSEKRLHMHVHSTLQFDHSMLLSRPSASSRSL